MRTSEHWIRELGLTPHPEGGHFRETYRSAETVAADALPDRFDGDRCLGTAIYFLLAGANFSAFHRIRSDEAWHFHDGTGLTIHVLTAGGTHERRLLGLDVERGDSPQVVVPAGYWFAAEVTSPDGFALVSCTVAPGFDYLDFELADRAALAAQYPPHRELVERLTRD